MAKSSIRTEDFFVALTLLLFATGLIVINVADDLVVTLGVFMVLVSVGLSLASSILTFLSSRRNKIARLLWIATSLIPLLFAVTYFFLADD